MMASSHLPDWDPRERGVLEDQIAAYDKLRSRCPVAFSEYLGWSLFRHEDVVRVLDDPGNFSNDVSSHVSVPNSMDPPAHTKFRRIIEPYFGDEALKAFAPECRRIAVEQVERLPAEAAVDVASDFAKEISIRNQCAFMGWPASLHEALRQWIRRNYEATLSGDREAMAAVAFEFDRHIRERLEERRAAGDAAPDDATTRLLRERVDERPLSDAEIVSIVRNWTVGELGTIAASIGILMHYLATHPDVQRLLRDAPEHVSAANDEILRIHAPLISNRRRATGPVEIGGRQLENDARISVIWASANRDEAVFGDPDEFRLDRDPEQNLLYGRGIHVCPGAPLARLELRIVMEELLARTSWMELSGGEAPIRAAYPGSGFSKLPMQIRREP